MDSVGLLIPILLMRKLRPELLKHLCAFQVASVVSYFLTLRTVALQALLSMGIFRQEHWSGLPCSSPGDLPDPGIKPKSLMSPALAGKFFTTSATWEAQLKHLPRVKLVPSS